MSKLKIAILVATSVTGFAVMNANAAIAIPAGWYLEGNLGVARVSNTNGGVENSSLKNVGVGWNVNVGYKFMPYFAGEIGGTSYANTSVYLNGYRVANDSIYSYDIAGKALLPVSDTGFELFAKLGFAGSHSHITQAGAAGTAGAVVAAGMNNGTGVFYGLGGDYAFTPAFSANLQWQRANSNNRVGTLDFYSVGVGYIFG